MARTKEKWSGVLAGKPEVVARHIEIPVKLYDDPDRPVVILIPLSKVPVFLRSLARLVARATGTRALLEEHPDFLPVDVDGDGAELPDAS